MTSSIISNHHLHLTSPKGNQNCFFLYLHPLNLYQDFDSHSVFPLQSVHAEMHCSPFSRQGHDTTCIFRLLVTIAMNIF